MGMATINVSFMAGSNIEGAFAESIRLAQLLNCWVEFSFNGVNCIGRQGGSVLEGVKAYHDQIKKKDGVKAFS